MQQTSKYKLNQWDLTDPILMSDFNADNEKLEAALGEKLERWEQIRDFTFNGGSTSTAFIPYAPHWGIYSFTAFFIEMRFLSDPPTTPMKFYIDITNHGSIPYSPAPGSLAFLFFPMKDLEAPIRGLMMDEKTVQPLLLPYPFRLFSGFRLSLNAASNVEVEPSRLTGYALR